MNDKKKTKEQLIQELEGLRRRISELDKAKESEEKFAKIFRTSPDPVAISRNSDGTYIDVNESFTKVSGYSREELIGHSPLPGDLDLWLSVEDREPFAKALRETGEALGLEIKFRRKDGAIRDCILSARGLDVGGEPCHIAITSDITERRQMQDELARREEKFRTIFENNTAAIAIVEPDSTFSMVNEAFCEVTGFTRQEIHGLSWTQIIPPEDLERMNEYNRRRRINPQDSPSRYEFTYYHKNGGIRHGLISASLIPSTMQLISSVLDITERKQAEGELRESMERFKLSMEATSDGLWDWNIRTDEAYFSPAYYRMLGYELGAFPGKGNSWKELIHPNDRERTLQVNLDCIEGRRDTFEVEYRMKASNGLWHWILGRGKCIARDERGRALRLVGTHVDVTERKQAEERLKKSKEKLRALSARIQSIREEERSNISREIHDDLGQRLTGLKMDSAWLLRHLHPDQSELKEKVQGMGQLIDQTVGTIRRISAELRPRILDDFGLVAALEWQSEEFTKKTGISCLFQSTGGQPKLKPDLSIAVFRIFQEALTNVVRHSGATKVDAFLKTYVKGLLLTIRDNGRGITEEEIIRSRSLGLVGMRERVLVFGGSIEIKGKEGKGTSIILQLPIK